jgi:hypothetical protein
MLIVCFDDDGANSNARAGQKTRTHAGGIREDQRNSRPRTEFHGAGNFFSDVERALLLQKHPPLLKGFPTKSPRILVGAGEENAGIIDIGDGLAIAFKIESHNHPSAVEPFQGAATGVGGIIRDIFTMGARPGVRVELAAVSANSVPRRCAGFSAAWSRASRIRELLRHPHDRGRGLFRQSRTKAIRW